MNDTLSLAALAAIAGVAILLKYRDYRWRRDYPSLHRLLTAVTQAEELRKRDPAAADLIQADAQAAYEASAAQDMADLRARASVDRQAAASLKRHLEASLRGFAMARQIVERKGSPTPQAAAELQRISVQEIAIRAELAALDVHRRRLR